MPAVGAVLAERKANLRERGDTAEDACLFAAVCFLPSPSDSTFAQHGAIGLSGYRATPLVACTGTKYHSSARQSAMVSLQARTFLGLILRFDSSVPLLSKVFWTADEVSRWEYVMQMRTLFMCPFRKLAICMVHHVHCSDESDRHS